MAELIGAGAPPGTALRTFGEMYTEALRRRA